MLFPVLRPEGPFKEFKTSWLLRAYWRVFDIWGCTKPLRIQLQGTKASEKCTYSLLCAVIHYKVWCLLADWVTGTPFALCLPLNHYNNFLYINSKRQIKPKHDKTSRGIAAEICPIKAALGLFYFFFFFEARFLFTYYQTLQLLKDIILLLSDEMSPKVAPVRSPRYLQMRCLSLAAVC